MQLFYNYTMFGWKSKRKMHSCHPFLNASMMDENRIDFTTNYSCFCNYCNNFATCTLMISPYAYVNLNLLLQLTYNDPIRKHGFSNGSS